MKCIMETLGMDPGWFGFVDFRRAFPSTKIELVKIILHRRGVPEQAVMDVVLNLLDKRRLSDQWEQQ
eukprot:gene8176-7528_t